MQKLSLDSEIFNRTVADIITREGLTQLLASGKKMRIKHGIDATGALHIGHMVSLWKLRALQEAGHKAVILLGDFTTTIGDPTGKSKTRPVLTRRDIEKNIRIIEKTIRSVLLTDSSVFELRRNSEWYGKMLLRDFLSLLSMITHARLIERDMFQDRIKKGTEIHAHELIYPLLQGYDSVMLRADATLIGSDQLFNEHIGRFFQEKYKQAPQAIVAMKLVAGLGGEEKMSKSLGNAIWVADTPREKFGKIMSLPDELILSYLDAYTDVSLSDIQQWKIRLESGDNPKNAKLFLASSLVKRYHGESVADKEKEYFLKVFSQKKEPDIVQFVQVSYGDVGIVDLLVTTKLADSRSEARRLVEQGAVKIDGGKIQDPNTVIHVKKGLRVRVGKKNFVGIR